MVNKGKPEVILCADIAGPMFFDAILYSLAL